MNPDQMGTLGFEPRSGGLEPPILASLYYVPVIKLNLTVIYKTYLLLRNDMNKYLTVILILAIFLRAYDLSDVPPEINIDEASVGYNAYAILSTGADEHGQPFPLFFEAFGDYKDPIFIYSTLPAITIFGLSTFAIRITALVWGILAIAALFFLTKELFDEKTALLAAFFLAIAPWHVQFSRIAFQLVAFPALFLFGFYFFIKGKRLISAIMLGLSCYAYGVARLFVPLFVIVLIWNKNLKKRETLKFILPFLLITLPLFYSSLFVHANDRFYETSIFQNENPVQMFIGQYINYFNPLFLFISGDRVNIYNDVHGFGLLHLLQLPLVLIGLYLVYKKKYWLLFAWLLLGPLPAALTRDIMSMRLVSWVGLFALLSSAKLF